MNGPNYAGLFKNLRLTLDNELDRTVTNKEWEYFTTEFNERLDAMTETIFQDMVEDSSEWLDDESEDAE
jgi:hypothetical protein